MKNRKILIIVLASLILFTSVGISTGFFDRVVSASKAFIYCKGDKLEGKK